MLFPFLLLLLGGVSAFIEQTVQSVMITCGSEIYTSTGNKTLVVEFLEACKENGSTVAIYSSHKQVITSPSSLLLKYKPNPQGYPSGAFEELHNIVYNIMESPSVLKYWVLCLVASIWMNFILLVFK